MQFKSILLLSSVFLILLSCQKENTPETANDTFQPTSSDTLIASGSFVSNDHPTSGNVSVYLNGKTQTLTIENFSSDNGPDLRVYLSTTLNDDDFVELGALIAVSGSFKYTFGDDVDVSKYNHVLIWCEDFNVLFGHAVLN